MKRKDYNKELTKFVLYLSTHQLSKLAQAIQDKELSGGAINCPFTILYGHYSSNDAMNAKAEMDLKNFHDGSQISDLEFEWATKTAHEVQRDLKTAIKLYTKN